MGPEPISYLEQAMSFIQKAIVDISLKEGGETIEDVSSGSNGGGDLICKLAEITGALERCMETQKRVNDLASGKMKCTTCGATSVGFDCHNGASSTPTTQRSSEERRKVSEEEDEELDEKCSSIGSQRIASVDSSSSVDGFENPIRSVSSSISAPADEEETMVAADVTDDSELVIKSILDAVKKEEIKIKQEPDDIKEEPMDQSAIFDQLLQNSLLGLTPEIKTETPPAENTENEQEQQDLLTNFFQAFLTNQFANPLENVSTSSDTGTESSQNSPPDNTVVEGTLLDNNLLDNTSLALLETLLAETAATSSADAKAAARKRKSTPIKVPKTENGAGYVCPMEGCNKIFKEKGSVHRHFVTHIGMRFNCDKCKASYTQKHALMLHQKIHANPDAYQCRGCGTNYTTQNGLRLHRQRNPTCMEVANAMDFTTKSNSTPNKQMVSAP